MKRASLSILFFVIAVWSNDFELPTAIDSIRPEAYIETLTVDTFNATKFTPIEVSQISNSTEQTEPALVSKKKTAHLNRPVNVGLFIEEKELFIWEAGALISITANRGELKIKKDKKTLHQKNFTLISQKNKDNCIHIATHKKAAERACYLGKIFITAKNEKLNAINSLNVEDYLRGVVPYEMGKLDNERFEALKTQAVAARTYVYKHFGSREAQGFDVYADTKDQVYKGLEGSTPLTDKAVLETAGIVMTYAGEFITAYYHSTCGGISETLETWNRPNLPYLTRKPDLDSDKKPWCRESSYSKWERTFDENELVKLFKANARDVKLKDLKFSKIKNIAITETLPSGRIKTLQVATNSGTFSVNTDKVRWLFKKNGTILPSSLFTIQKKDSQWILTGKGFGHGVGMCQMGARARAKKGQNFAQILTHYYSGVTLEKFIP